MMTPLVVALRKENEEQNTKNGSEDSCLFETWERERVEKYEGQNP